MLNSFTSNVDFVCVVACARVECICVSVLFVHHLWWLLYYDALNNLVIYTYIEQMDESHSCDVVRQKYMLI